MKLFIKEFLGLVKIEDCRFLANLLIAFLWAASGYCSYHYYGYSLTVVICAFCCGSRIFAGKI